MRLRQREKMKSCFKNSALVLCLSVVSVQSADQLRGKIYNGSADSTAVSNQTVELLEFKDDQSLPSRVQERQSRQDGSFTFAGLRKESPSQFRAAVVYKGVRYFSKAVQISPSVPLPDLDIVVYDTLNTAAPIEQQMHHLFIQDKGDRISIREIRVVVNPTDRAILDVWRTDGIHKATLRYSLPSEAIHLKIPVESSDHLQGSEKTVDDLSIILPGSHRVSYGYEIPWQKDSAQIDFVLDYPTLSFNLFNSSTELTLQSEQLIDHGRFAMRDQVFQRVGADSLSRGTRIQVLLQKPSASAISGWTIGWITAGLLALGLLISIWLQPKDGWEKFSALTRLQQQKQKLQEKIRTAGDLSSQKRRQLLAKKTALEAEIQLRKRYR